MLGTYSKPFCVILFLSGSKAISARWYRSLIKKYSGYKRTLYLEGEPITCMNGLNMPEHAIHLSFLAIDVNNQNILHSIL